MRYFPLFADLENADVLVVGGGEQAAQKVRLLRKTGARVTVVAETVDATSCAELGEQGAISRSFRAPSRRGTSKGSGSSLPPPATALSTPPSSSAAKAEGVPVNVVDAPELSTFIMPAIVDRAPVTVAIGTEGAAPVLAREIKSRIESLLPANLGALASRAQGLRKLHRRGRPRRARPPPPVGAAAAGAVPPRRAERGGGRGRSHSRGRAARQPSARPRAAWR